MEIISKISNNYSINEYNKNAQKEIKNFDFNKIDLNKIEENKKIEEVKQSDSSNVFEAILSEQSFGYNIKTNDFYIKVKRGDSISQYPTDEMMRLKEYIISMKN